MKEEEKERRTKLQTRKEQLRHAQVMIFLDNRNPKLVRTSELMVRTTSELTVRNSLESCEPANL